MFSENDIISFSVFVITLLGSGIYRKSRRKYFFNVIS